MAKDYLEVLAGHTLQQRQFRHQELFQRRNQLVDQFGIRYVASGWDGSPATVKISVSPDLIYYSKWEMKFEINPTMSNASSYTQTTAKNFQFFIDGVDMTPYFKLQYHGYWIKGNGIYPNAQMSTYDILDACKYMTDEEREKVLKPGYKDCTMYGDGTFTLAIDNYIKYSFMNR